MCADTGAVQDVLGRECGSEAKHRSNVNVKLMGMGGSVDITEVGDYTFTGDLHAEQGLINPDSDMTMMYIYTR